MTLDEVIGLLRRVRLSGIVKSQNIMMPCPFASVPGSPHRTIYLPCFGILPTDEYGAIFHCFKCGRKGTLRQLFLQLEEDLKYDCTQVIAKLDAILDKDPEEIAASIPRYSDHFEPLPPYAIFPDSWLSAYSGKVPRYILERGIELSTCKEWSLGFDKPSRRVFFPVRDSTNSLVGAVGRMVFNNDNLPRYQNYWSYIHSVCQWPLDHRNGIYHCPSCGGKEVPFEQVLEGFRKSKFLYGEWMFPKGKTAVIVEGIVDTLKIYQAVKGWKKDEYYPICLLGSSPSQNQANKIVSLTGGKVISFLDDDKAGKEGDKRLRGLLLRRVRFFRAEYPEGKHDPDECTQEEIRKAILDSKVYFS